jgi:hypothetical protein
METQAAVATVVTSSFRLALLALLALLTDSMATVPMAAMAAQSQCTPAPVALALVVQAPLSPMVAPSRLPQAMVAQLVMCGMMVRTTWLWLVPRLLAAMLMSQQAMVPLQAV